MNFKIELKFNKSYPSYMIIIYAFQLNVIKRFKYTPAEVIYVFKIWEETLATISWLAAFYIQLNIK